MASGGPRPPGPGRASRPHALEMALGGARQQGPSDTIRVHCPGSTAQGLLRCVLEMALGGARQQGPRAAETATPVAAAAAPPQGCPLDLVCGVGRLQQGFCPETEEHTHRLWVSEATPEGPSAPKGSWAKRTTFTSSKITANSVGLKYVSFKEK